MRKFEDLFAKKWYIAIPLSLVPILIITSIGAHITAGQPINTSPSRPQLNMASQKTQSSKKDDKNGSTSIKGAVTSRQSYDCGTGQPVTAGLSGATNLIIRKLAQYEKLCGGGITDTLMIFTSMPVNESNAKAMAGDMAVTLKEFYKFKLTPLVVMEPTTESGLVNLTAFSNGEYDSALATYFQTLKSSGINDSMMGVWAPFPECNIPEWGSTNPSQFQANFKKAASIQKKIFPGSKITIILDSLSYPPGELDWDGGSYVSLAPYLKGIPKGLVSSFGYQGFPWAAPANEPNYSNYDAGKFLKPSIAKEAAQLLGTKNIWLNTGTFKAFHANDSAKKVIASTALRTKILDDIIAQADWLKGQGFKVTVSLFAENKADTAEGVDWSYWAGVNPSGGHAGVLKSFLGNLRSKSIGFWLFDSL